MMIGLLYRTESPDYRPDLRPAEAKALFHEGALAPGKGLRKCGGHMYE